MTKQTAHRQGIDLARFIAAFGVVVAHAEASPKDWSGHLSLGLFLILTAFLAVQSAGRAVGRAGGTYDYLSRARRLVLPWVVWSLFFILVEEVVSDEPQMFATLRTPWVIFYGGSIHLWFLPFVALAMALVGPAVRLITTPARLQLAALILIGLSAPLFWAHETLGMPEPMPQWAFALPCYVLGLLLGIGHPMGKAWMPLTAGLALTALAVWLGNAAPWTLTILIALVAFEVFWRLPLRGAWLPPLGKVAFGIYLSHPFFMLVVYKFAGPAVNPFLGACAAFLMSWAAIAIGRRIPLFARIT